MLSVKSADNPKTLSIIEMFRAGTKIPNKLISAIPIIADVLDMSNPLLGSDDQKCFLSLTINTLN